MTEAIQKQPDTEIDYIQIVDADTLKEIEKLKGSVLVALAVNIGKTRLIDNMELNVQ